MNSRRQFVRQGALATTALLVAGPLKVFANSGSSFTGLTRYNNHLVFLHTAETDITAHGKTIQYIADIKNNAANTILLNGGQRQPVNFKFDVYAAGAEESDANYTIVTKGGIKTAVIIIKTGDADVINKTNRLAAYLKEEKNCQLIVCLSPLGYKHKNAPDDITLAAQSKYIDLIINGHSSNFSPKTIVLANSKKQEVILQSSKGNALACGKIEIGFDERGSKNHIHYATKLSKKSGVAA